MSSHQTSSHQTPLNSTPPHQFDIKVEFENLLNHSQKIIFQYDFLIKKIQNFPIEPELKCMLNCLIKAYYEDMEDKKASIKSISENFKDFDKVFKLQEQLNKYYELEQKTLIECKSIIKQKESLRA